MPNTELHWSAAAVILFVPMTVVIDDGHLWPYAQVFTWPDGSPGICVRLEEDGIFPSLLELTHASSGTKIEVEVRQDSLLGKLFQSYARATGEKDTVQALVDAGGAAAALNYVRNFETGDGFKSFWMKVTDPAVTENGADQRVALDGTKFIRLVPR